MRTGNVVISGGGAVSAAIASGTIIGTVPVGYRPSGSVYIVVKSGTTFVNLRIEAEGNIVNEDALPASFGLTGGWVAI